MGGSESSTKAKIYVQTCEQTAMSMALQPPKIWERFSDDVSLVFKHTHLENIKNLHQNIKFTIENKSL